MPLGWGPVFQAVQGQDKSPSFAAPISPSGSYYAFLDKADWNPRESLWYLMFDMIPAESALLGLASDTADDMPPPRMPDIIFHATGVTKDAVWAALGLSGDDEPAEASWYALFLQQNGDPQTQVVGDLYHPDTDFVEGAPSYGKWHIAASILIASPVPPKGKTLFRRPPPPRPGASPAAALSAKAKTPRPYRRLPKTIGVKKSHRYRPRTQTIQLRKRPIRRAVVPPPPPPGYGALGVMAIGQGGFNLLFDRGTREPAFYYDTGYPLGFFINSVPPTMRPGNAAFQGPIIQNTAGNLQVILSHWDWDHWRFGNFVNGLGQSLGQRPWTVPFQAMSPAAANFIATVAAVAVVTVVPAGAPAQAIGANGLTLYKMQPGLPAPAAFIQNNSGLAVRVPVDLAAMQSAPVLLTGDGNFNLLPGPALWGLQMVGAVHHGSNNHGAAANLPAPAGLGRIAYSYGINPATGVHSYGFPHPAALAAYQAANWGPANEQATAEAAINVGPSAPGNVRVGDQNALPGAYLGTAFAAIGYPIP